MKLAYALTERADLQKRLAQLENRLMNNAKVQEGETPAEDPQVLLKELDGIMKQLEDLIGRINHTNSVTMDNGDSLTALLARRDCLNQRVHILRNFLNSASSTVSRATRSEIKIKSTVSVVDLQRDVDRMSRELRELDGRIQALNWTTELL